MKLLVTGGYGFIGSNFIRYMINKYPDYKIVNLDKLTYAGNIDNLKDIEGNPNYEFVYGDICDGSLIESIASDVIVNFAAETHVDRSIINAEDFIRTNVLGTYTLLEAARKRNTRFIQISTDEVYGSVEVGESTEESHLRPNSPYSASKASADIIARSYFKTFGLPVIITRASNNFGKYQYPEKIIPLFITNALKNKHLPIYGDGENVREWMYVEDHCKAIDTVLHKGKWGEIYNVGSGNRITNNDLVNLILDIMGKPRSLIVKVADRLGHDRRYALDCSKIKELGVGFDTDFRISLEETIKWYSGKRNV